MSCFQYARVFFTSVIMLSMFQAKSKLEMEIARINVKTKDGDNVLKDLIDTKKGNRGIVGLLFFISYSSFSFNLN